VSVFTPLLDVKVNEYDLRRGGLQKWREKRNIEEVYTDKVVDERGLLEEV